jgi:hypothetical protein
VEPLNAREPRLKIVFLRIGKAGGTSRAVVDNSRAALIRASLDKIQTEASFFSPEHLVGIDAEAAEAVDDSFGNRSSRKRRQVARFLAE